MTSAPATGTPTMVANATVVDGTGQDPFVADVSFVDDRIVSIEPHAGETDGAHVVDATGLVLAPGFVDVHTHDDWALLLAPNHECKTEQGVTSVVVGNCGISPFPPTDNMPGTESFDRLSDYFDAIRRQGTAVNVAALAGHGSLRTAVMGLRTDRSPDAAELAHLLELTEQALEDGAIGLSSGLAYEPGRYASADEMIELNRLVADAGGIYTTHMRNEADGLLDSIDESIAVAEAAGVSLQISHLKAGGRDNWGAVHEALERIDAARARGVDVMADQYPYTAGSTLLEQIVNAGALDGPSSFGTVHPDQILIAAAPRHPEWEGRTITEIAADEGVEPRAMADNVVAAEGRSCLVVLEMMSEDDVRAVLKHPLVMVGTDGVPAGGKPHPRLGHTYPRVLGRYVRDEGLLDLPDAIHRMTKVPAERFGFEDRGEIRVGAFADLVLFDPMTIIDTGTYADPTQTPAGIARVWVNGQPVVEGGVATGQHPGRVVTGRQSTGRLRP